MERKGLLFTHFAVLLFGLAGVIGKAVTLPAILVTFGRVAFSSVALLIFMKLKKEPFRLGCMRDYRLMFLGGGIMAIHWWSFMQSIQCSTVAIGTITFSTFPLFVTFLEPILYREPFRFKSLYTSILLLIGVFIMVPFGGEQQVTLGILWGMVSSFTYAGLSLLNRRLSGVYSGRTICFYQQGFACLLLLPALWLVPAQPTATDIVAIAILGILCTAVAHTLFITGLGFIKVQTAGIISGMESVYAVILAGLLLGELPTLKEIMGGGIILATTLYSSLEENKH